jgi:hypothetical protein
MSGGISAEMEIPVKSEDGLRSSRVSFRLSFVVLSVLSILPCWTVRYPALADYPQHLARWFVLFHSKDPKYHFSTYYLPDWGPYPYVLTDVIGVLLQRFLTIDVAGRCILTICIVAVPFATLYFLRKAAPGNDDSLALFGFLIALNPFFLMGFVENQLSLALGLLVVGLWVTYCEKPNVVSGIAVAAGILLVYLAHLVGFAVVGVAMGVYSLVRPRPWKNLLTLAVVSLPGLMLYAYNIKRSASGGSFAYDGMTVWDKLRGLVFPLAAVSRLQELVFLGGIAAFLCLLYRIRPKVAWQRSWILICAVLLSVYLAAPGVYGLGGWLDVRIMPFVYLFALAIVRIKRISRTMVAVVILLVVLRIGVVEYIFVSKQNELNELTAAFQAIHLGARVLPLVQLKAQGTLVGRAEVHHQAYGVIEEGFFVPTIAYLPGLQPLRVIGAGYCPNAFCEVTSPTATDWSEVARHYDYLWVQGYPEVVPSVATIADPVFFNDFVAVYRVRRSSGN